MYILLIRKSRYLTAATIFRGNVASQQAEVSVIVSNSSSEGLITLPAICIRPTKEEFCAIC